MRHVVPSNRSTFRYSPRSIPESTNRQSDRVADEYRVRSMDVLMVIVHDESQLSECRTLLVEGLPGSVGS